MERRSRAKGFRPSGGVREKKEEGAAESGEEENAKKRGERNPTRGKPETPPIFQSARLDPRDVLQRVVGELAEVRPQPLLGQVHLGRAAPEPHDGPTTTTTSSALRRHGGGRSGGLPALRQRLLGHPVRGIHPRVRNEAREQFHPMHGRVRRQRLGQFDHVLDLPAGVGVAAQLHAFAPDQAVERDEDDVEA